MTVLRFEFKDGDSVQWVSQAGGSTKLKQGEVIQVIPPNGKVDPAAIVKRHGGSKCFGYGGPRDHESYIVRVPGATPKSKGKLYWPVVSLLRKA